MKLYEILKLIDDLEEIVIFKSYKYNDDYEIKEMKKVFMKTECYKKYKGSEVKGIYPEENVQCIILK